MVTQTARETGSPVSASLDWPRQPFDLPLPPPGLLLFVCAVREMERRFHLGQRQAERQHGLSGLPAGPPSGVDLPPECWS
jgi:hypothetical protein